MLIVKLKLMWGTIGILIIALVVSVVIIFNQSSGDKEETKTATKESTKEPEKEVEEEVEEESEPKTETVYTRPEPEVYSLGYSLTPDVFAYRFNKFYQDIEIDMEVKFSQPTETDVLARVSNNTTIVGKISPETEELISMSIVGEDLGDETNLLFYQSTLISFVHAVTDPDMEKDLKNYILNEGLDYDKVTSDDEGKSEFTHEGIKFNLYKETISGDKVSSLEVTNTNNE